MPPVYVLSKDGQPLMPCKPARARHLLEAGEAEVVGTEPMVLRLNIETSNAVQPVTVGVDMGSRKVGLAVVGQDRVLYQGELILRADIHKRMEGRASYRRTRRSRKLRHRSPRFNNRAASRRKGRLPPSVQSRVDSVVAAVKRLTRFMPVSKIVVEIADFDLQKLKAGRFLRNWEYQRGEIYGFENIKMYVRHRDNYTCQYCGKKNPSDLEVDHIIPVSRGGSTVPENMVASCHECNQVKGKMTAAEFGHPKLQEGVRRPLRDAAITQMGKNATLQGLKEIVPTSVTYGYITKVDREKMGLPKMHYNDAVAIACGGEPVETLDCYEIVRAISRGARKQRRGAHSQLVARLPYEMFGYRMWDKVKTPNNAMAFVGSRYSSGAIGLKDIEGNILCRMTHKKLGLARRYNQFPREQQPVLARPSEVNDGQKPAATLPGANRRAI